MDWHGGHVPKEGTIADTGHILAVSSGNAQTNYCENDKFNEYAPLSSRTPSRTATQRYPVPTTTLRSNDHRAQNQQRLRINRLKRRSELAWRCWRHPSYLKYISRPRRDADKKGETIWEDDVERAFSNAIVNIPAMGKSKKSQHGKACGRNELIQEWILQETGKKRERKQVSSHIQVFDGMFKSVPEWRALNKIPKNPISQDCMKDDEYEYYSNSIADMVRVWKGLNRQSANPDVDSETDQSGYPLGNISLSRLYFEMWISQPEKIDQVLHRYTQVQSDQSSAPVDHLEDIENWRDCWPDLVSIIETRPPQEKFDVILLETSCQLKDDFPPPKSKLGISLELEFSDLSSNKTFFATHSTWSCTSHFYQKGKLEAKAEYDQCHSLGPGKVEPPFESKWWAEKFIQLTKRYRQASDLGDEAGIAAAAEANRNYLRSLKAMQQISCGPETILSPQDMWYEPSGGQRRTAILLWSFAETSGNSAGLTAWRRLIPPPRRVDMNSPSSAAVDMTLPPFNLDMAMDTTTEDTLFNLEPDPLASSFTDNKHVSSSSSERYVSHDITLQLPSQTDHVDDSYHRATFVENIPIGLQHILDFQHDGQWSQENVLQDNCQSLYEPHSVLTSNYFEAHDDWTKDQNLPEASFYDDHQAHHVVTAPSHDDFGHRQPLLNFDMNTHALLQAQLEGNQQDKAPNFLDCQPRPTLCQHGGDDQMTAINCTDSQAEVTCTNAQAFDSNTRTRLPSENPSNFDCVRTEQSVHTEAPDILSPIAQRPILQHHHSFAGLSRYDSEPHTSLSHASRTELALLLEGFETDCKEVEGQNLQLMPHTIHGLELTRPHTQPPPLTHDLTDPMYHNIDQTYVNGQSSLQREWVEVKLDR